MKRFCFFTFTGNGNFEGSAVLGVWMAVKGGGHEWVISWEEIEKNNNQLLIPNFITSSAAKKNKKTFQQ